MSGDGIEIIVGNTRLDSAESLESRMQRLQKFFESALAIDSIMNFELSINIEQGDDFETVSINVKDFKNQMLKLYEREDNWTPIIKLIITKN
ncbi:MAG: hypothetical protein LBV08_10625 [Clostridiales bacterium]|nr:hypothetical protein [Clostridiales bacterium]